MTTPRVATRDDVDAIAEGLRASDVVAIDTEFHSERRHVPALYLVQFRLPSGAIWIVDPMVDGLLQGIAEPLRQTTWIVHGGRWDMEILMRALGGLPAQVWDTQIAAGLVGTWWPAPYSALVEIYLGESVDKSATLSDWSRRPLTADQVRYAASDVERLQDVWTELASRLDALGRTEHALDACDEARRRVLEGPDPFSAWRMLGAAAALQPQQIGVLQEIAAWRLERARLTNQPERSILGDGTVVELARRQPTTRAALTANRRLPKSLHKNAESLLERIERAARRPEESWPRSVRRRTPEWHTVAFLDVWANALGEKETFASGLVLPRRTLEDVVLADDDAGIAEALGSWRPLLVQPALANALAGRVSLGLRDRTLQLFPGPG